MKNDNNERRNDQNNGRPKEQPTLMDAARLSIGSNTSLPPARPGITRENLLSIIQRTLELVEDGFDDLEDDFSFPSSHPNNTNFRGPFNGQ